MVDDEAEWEVAKELGEDGVCLATVFLRAFALEPIGIMTLPGAPSYP